MDDGRILRGTTTPVKIKPIVDDTFDFSSVDGLELTFKQGKLLLIKGLQDCILDTEEGSVTYHFTEAETLEFNGSKDAPPVQVQLRFLIGEEIVGTGEGIIRFKDLLSNRAFVRDE